METIKKLIGNERFFDVMVMVAIIVTAFTLLVGTIYAHNHQLPK